MRTRQHTFFAWLLLGAVLVAEAASPAGRPAQEVGVHTNSAPTARTVMAWATSTRAVEAASQLLNGSWAGIFDGVQASCGFAFTKDGSRLVVNKTVWDACAPLHAACRKTGAKFNVWIGAPPNLDNPEAVAKSAVALAEQYDVDGYSIDDESDCAPRSTLVRFAAWMDFINAFAKGLNTSSSSSGAPAAAGRQLTLSAAVQAMFGVQDVHYKPLCQPPDNPSCSQACNMAPYTYAPEPRVAEMMSNSSIDRWLEMDTYYFGTDRFLGALDWYASNVALGKLGVAVMNRDDISPEGYLSRFHAIDRSGANWLNVFLLPAANAWRPFLRRWKTRCAGCGANTLLGCYDLGLTCDPPAGPGKV